MSTRLINVHQQGAGHKYCTAVQHHADVIDSEAPVNPGNHGDVSLFLGTFHRGLDGSPIREKLDPKLIHVEQVGRLYILFYDRHIVGTAVLARDEDFSIDICERFSRMIDAFAGLVTL